MIINSIIAAVGGGGTPANMRTYNITTEVTWGNFIAGCGFQLMYKNSAVTIFVTGSTAPSAGATTTLVLLAHLGTTKSAWFRNSQTGGVTPDYVNTNKFSSTGTSAVEAYWGISAAGVIGAGGSSIASLIPANSTVTMTESPFDNTLWGS